MDEQQMTEDGRAGAVVAGRESIGVQSARAPNHQQQMRQDDLPEGLLPARRLCRQREKRS